MRATLAFDFDDDVVAAQRDFDRALQLSPRDPRVLVAHNFFLTSRGHLARALEELDLLVSIDPGVAQYYCYRGRLLYFLQRYGEALAEYDKALQLDPDHPATLEWSVLAYLAVSRREDATRRVSQFEAADPGWAAASRAWIAAAAGDGARARAYSDETAGLGPWYMAIVHAALGERDAALANLERVAERNRGILAFAFLTHFFDHYRSDPAFLDLLEKSGFEFQPRGTRRER